MLQDILWFLWYVLHQSLFNIPNFKKGGGIAGSTSRSLARYFHTAEFTIEIHHHRPSPMKDAMLAHTSVLSPQLLGSVPHTSMVYPWVMMLHVIRFSIHKIHEVTVFPTTERDQKFLNNLINMGTWNITSDMVRSWHGHGFPTTESSKIGKPHSEWTCVWYDMIRHWYGMICIYYHDDSYTLSNCWIVQASNSSSKRKLRGTMTLSLLATIFRKHLKSHE